MGYLDDLAIARRVGAEDERKRIVAEIRRHADQIRAVSFNQTIGEAAGAIVDEVGDRVAAMPVED